MENDYKVADINLAEFGRREISLAENEMSIWLEDLNFSLNYLKEINTKKPKSISAKIG